MTHTELARRDALERWNVGYAREWDTGIATVGEVQAALEGQAVANGWDVEPAQLAADAEGIADWLERERAPRVYTLQQGATAGDVFALQ